MTRQNRKEIVVKTIVVATKVPDAQFELILVHLGSPMLEAALQALDLANLDLYLSAQLLVLRGQVLEVRRTLVRVLPRAEAQRAQRVTINEYTTRINLFTTKHTLSKQSAQPFLFRVISPSQDSSYCMPVVDSTDTYCLPLP